MLTLARTAEQDINLAKGFHSFGNDRLALSQYPAHI